MEQLQRIQDQQIKKVANDYIKQMIKNLKDKAFKHHLYSKHLDIALNLARILGPEKTSSIIFSKEPRLQKKDHMIIKDKAKNWKNIQRQRSKNKKIRL